MDFRIFKTTLLFILLSALVLPNFILGQEDLAQVCQLEAIEKKCNVFSQSECKQLLEKCDTYYRAESEKIGKDITKTEQEQRTIQNQINILISTIQKLDLQIQQGNVMIKDLSYQIKDTEYSIESTSLKIDDSREKLAAILQTINEEDQISLIEVLLAGETLSDFFDNLMALEMLNLKSHELLEEIKDLKIVLEGQKQNLDVEKGDVEKVIKIQSLQKQQSRAARTEQETFLRMTEAQKQQYLREKEQVEKVAAEIRARIFQLAGVQDVDAPTFGEALELAKWVQHQTGVRPAFLLSIITQESALGRNVGQCYIADKTSGASVGMNTGRRFLNGIHPTRDLPRLLQITGELGMDPMKTPISCPLSYGWGGAMGPAQFIPSTWLLVRSQVAAILGRQPNPWSIRDSFLAAGVLLRENGAAVSETRAAARYFGTANLGYESAVMQRASCIQVFIDQGTITSSCERLVFIP